jgi:GalNAc-alpha-(1->4)-GalNAc-alpha-(1->3)-diNAcBac-PP-undecaprenol alpha-1,4-N-acetyl-D-galactosaminyltransferase
VVADPGAWMLRASVFILSSRFEGFPNVLLEAMALGCPVIAADCPSGPAEIVVPDETGLLVPKEDPQSLARALSRLIEDPVLREQLGRNARSVRAEFALVRIRQKWDKVIADALA